MTLENPILRDPRPPTGACLQPHTLQTLNPAPAGPPRSGAILPFAAAEPVAPFAQLPFTTVELGFDTEALVSARVPLALYDMIEYVLGDGLVEGIFRVSGLVRRMKQVSSDFANYKEWLAPPARPSPHDVCGLVKKCLRQYLDHIHGLFSEFVQDEMRSMYMLHVRGSLASSDTFLSARSEFGEPQPPREPRVLLDKVALLLARRNPLRKNAFFLYLLLVLRELGYHEATTKMSVANSAIIFQPYLFPTLALEELGQYRELLTFLVNRLDTLLERYAEHAAHAAPLLEVELVSVTLCETNSPSPLTDYSLDYSPPQKLERRRSFVPKLLLFVDQYSVPANKYKRFSLGFASKLSLSHALDSKRPSEQRMRSSSSVAPLEPRPTNALALRLLTRSGKSARSSISKQKLPEEPETRIPLLQLPEESNQPFPDTKVEVNRRRSLMAMFKLDDVARLKLVKADRRRSLVQLLKKR